jgi:hypothetical protein
VTGAFAADWLALREPYDAAARSPALTAAFAAALPPAPRLIDLGGGTGSNLRHLAPRLRRPQEWLLTDRDDALLRDALPPAMSAFARSHGWSTAVDDGGALTLDLPHGPVRLRTRRVDLSRDLASVLLDGAADAVTTSALLDLTSAAWLRELAVWCAAARLPLLAALTYDGVLAFHPADDGGDDRDRWIERRFNAHQRRDKGFGPALGPEAALHLALVLRALGFEIRLDRSDWRLGPDDRAMLLATLDGIADAAREAGPEAADAVDAWAAHRRAAAERGTLSLRVGHLDLLALPPT